MPAAKNGWACRPKKSRHLSTKRKKLSKAGCTGCTVVLVSDIKQRKSNEKAWLKYLARLFILIYNQAVRFLCSLCNACNSLDIISSSSSNISISSRDIFRYESSNRFLAIWISLISSSWRFMVVFFSVVNLVFIAEINNISSYCYTKIANIAIHTLQ